MAGWKRVHRLALLIMLIPLIIGACSDTQPLPATGVPTTKSTPASSSSSTISISGVNVIEGQRITVRGGTNLSDDNCIHTQLFSEDDSLLRWPADSCIRPTSGAWETTMPLGQGGAPDQLDPQVEYVLRAWQQNDPSVVSEPFWFDIAGPPEPNN